MLRTDPDVQIMHPWFIDYRLLDAPVRDLVWAMNHTGMVETLCSCGGHTESAEWVEDGVFAAYVQYKQVKPRAWATVLDQIMSQTSTDAHYRIALGGRGDRWLAVVVDPGPELDMRRNIDEGLSKVASTVSRFLCKDHLAVSASARAAQPIQHVATCR
ncbi:MAG: hypothetical protein FJ319_07565 [SAR202 cluster bacterium]|nr:hypothetical protein [SAR202 cluster bacterium]